MMYKPYYSDILIISSMFYYFTALMDFLITTDRYIYYGDLFFQMEMNPAICFLLKLGIPPIHMFVIPMVVIFLSVYFKEIANEIHAESIIRDRVIWGMWFAICLMIMMGILHLIGFCSWFYHGVF